VTQQTLLVRPRPGVRSDLGGVRSPTDDTDDPLADDPSPPETVLPYDPGVDADDLVAP
jgi:hypothetical protein